MRPVIWASRCVEFLIDDCLILNSFAMCLNHIDPPEIEKWFWEVGTTFHCLVSHVMIPSPCVAPPDALPLIRSVNISGRSQRV